MNGLSIWKDPGKLAASHARPMTDTSCIHVHERCVRAWIIADTANVLAQTDGPELGYIDARDKEVHGAALRVLAFLGHTTGALAQHVVRLQGPVAGNHVNVFVRIGFLVDFPNQIEQLRIHIGGLIPAPVAHEMVQFLEARSDIPPIALEGNVGPLFGMGIVQLQGSCLCAGICCAEYSERATGEGHGDQV